MVRTLEQLRTTEGWFDHFEDPSVYLNGWGRLPPINITERVCRKRRRVMTLERAKKQAAKAGIQIVGATLNPDGSITLQFEQNGGGSFNEWDTVK